MGAGGGGGYLRDRQQNTNVVVIIVNNLTMSYKSETLQSVYHTKQCTEYYVNNIIKSTPTVNNGIAQSTHSNIEKGSSIDEMGHGQ